MKTSFSLIFLAGGSGTRFGTKTPKQFLPLGNKPVALHSFETICSLNPKEICVVCETKYRDFFKIKNIKLVFALPGKTRFESVKNGLSALKVASNLILIHDSARPFIQSCDILSVLNEADTYGSATLGIPVSSTMKEVDEKGFVIKTLQRSSIFEIQTPQVLRADILKKGIQKALEINAEVTDDLFLSELLNLPAKIVCGNKTNFKITEKQDLEFAKFLLDDNSCK